MRRGTDKNTTGYKVGRVDQAETALGAEMRLAADKGKGKKATGKGGGDKIVKRSVTGKCLFSRLLTSGLGSYTRYTPMELSSTKNSLQTIKLVTAFRSVRVAEKTKRTRSVFVCWTVQPRNSTSAPSPTMFVVPSWRPCSGNCGPRRSSTPRLVDHFSRFLGLTHPRQ